MTSQEFAQRLAKWAKGHGFDAHVDVSSSGRSAYVDITSADGAESRKVRFSDHAAELSSYHWGKSDDVDFDVVPEGQAGAEYANAHTLSEAATWLAKQMGVPAPPWAKAAAVRKKRAEDDLLARQAASAARMKRLADGHQAARVKWLEGLPPPVREVLVVLNQRADAERGKRRKRAKEKIRAYEKANGAPPPPDWNAP